MTGTKRPHDSSSSHPSSPLEPAPSQQPPSKRRRPNPVLPPSSRPPTRDLLTPLSDELLLRILSFLPPRRLLAIAPVSRRLYHLAADSQLWRALYYARFVLPRAMRIPGFREGGVGGGNLGRGGGHRLLQYAGGRSKVVEGVRVDWKREYKIRYNWARGKCVVEELRVGEGGGTGGMLVKVVEGVAVTADREGGLRAWDLKTRSLIGRVGTGGDGGEAVPSCIAVDEGEFARGMLDVALGFDDGSFGVWRLFTGERRLELRYRHEKSSNGGLRAMAFSYPFLLTATQSVLVSLYTFVVPATTTIINREPGERTGQHGERLSHDMATTPSSSSSSGKLPPPYLLTSLDSHTSRPPLALSLRKAGRATVASVAYTFSTRRGWSIGVQDLHVQPAGPNAVPEITTTRIAYTNPVETGGSPPLTPPATPHPRHRQSSTIPTPQGPTPNPPSADPPEPGPTTLCYTHPYLLATLPDNTLILHTCTSTASSLSISDGVRLWGHTSGISDAEITARGKAVSVSSRGEEMRVWELEGRSSAGMHGGVGSRSVEIRPSQQVPGESLAEEGEGERMGGGSPVVGGEWDERRNWVGFDDEMVIVLKERGRARQSLMVYDFT